MVWGGVLLPALSRSVALNNSKPASANGRHVNVNGVLVPRRWGVLRCVDVGEVYAEVC